VLPILPILQTMFKKKIRAIVAGSDHFIRRLLHEPDMGPSCAPLATLRTTCWPSRPIVPSTAIAGGTLRGSYSTRPTLLR
jgi:hypothetical protein